MKMSDVKEKCPALYSTIVTLASDNMGKVNSDYTFPNDEEVLRAEKALTPIYGKTLGDVIPSKGLNYDYEIDFFPGVENDPAIDHYLGLDTIQDAIGATLPDHKFLSNFINRIFQFDLSDAIKPCWL